MKFWSNKASYVVKNIHIIYQYFAMSSKCQLTLLLKLHYLFRIIYGTYEI